MIDANFKLKSKDRGAPDIHLGSGWAYVVEHTRYQKHVVTFADAIEVRSRP